MALGKQGGVSKQRGVSPNPPPKTEGNRASNTRWPVSKGVLASSFCATGRGDRTGQAWSMVYSCTPLNQHSSLNDIHASLNNTDCPQRHTLIDGFERLRPAAWWFTSCPAVNKEPAFNDTHKQTDDAVGVCVSESHESCRAFKAAFTILTNGLSGLISPFA